MDPGNRFARCLLEQKNEESRQAKRLLRRTVLLAVLIQALVLGLLMLRPLFGASADALMIARLVPLPPWKGAPGSREPERPRPIHLRPHAYDIDSHPLSFHPPERPAEHLDNEAAPEISAAGDAPAGPGFGSPDGLLPNLGLSERSGPVPPVQHREDDARPRKPKLVPSELQEAKLISRIEPIYPVLAKEIRLEGTVVIRAIIAKDGTVESVEILSGHPLLVQAARDAIVRWRYRPTLLNGQPVEVETLVIVIFRMH